MVELGRIANYASGGNSHGRSFDRSCSCGKKRVSNVGNVDGFQGAFNWLFAGFETGSKGPLTGYSRVSVWKN